MTLHLYTQITGTTKRNLSKSFLNQVMDMKARRPDKYQHQILGGWLAKAEGTVFRNWRVGDYLQTEHSCYGQDFGFSVDINNPCKNISKQRR